MDLLPPKEKIRLPKVNLDGNNPTQVFPKTEVLRYRRAKVLYRGHRDPETDTGRQTKEQVSRSF